MNNFYDVKIVSTGMYVPEKVLTNDYLSTIVDTNDQWITERTGIRERRITQDDNTSDLGAKAALEALKNANLTPEDIDLIVVGTTTPDNYTPCTATMIQGKIEAKNAIAFDVSAACSGFIFALETAVQYIKAGTKKRALVIGAEVLSKMVDWSDRSTCVLFGDGAGAVVVERSDTPGIISIYTETDGSKGMFIGINGVSINNIFASNEKKDSLIFMNGREVFKFAVSKMPESVNKVLQDSGCTIDDIKYIIPHQANYRIIEAAAKKLGVSKDKFYINVNKYGNTSSASIPIALDEVNSRGLLKKGDKIILTGFGGGLSFGAILLEW